MTDHGEEKRDAWRIGVINTARTPLAFFVLSLLVVEALLGALLLDAEGSDRTIAIVGMLVLLFGVGAAVVFLAVRGPQALLGEHDTSLVRQSLLGFDRIVTEIVATVDRLERDGDLLNEYSRRGEFNRLRDGLYSAVLYASAAVPYGRLDPTFYGNLMEWNAGERALRVRYFMGPYNDEIITRAFPLKGPKQGVASAAVESRQIQVRNSMESELKERNESRLRSMMSVPLMTGNQEPLPDGVIAVINIDSVVENAFPEEESVEFAPVQKRAKELAALIRRINELATSPPNLTGSARTHVR
jgi:hypothetical protein